MYVECSCYQRVIVLGLTLAPRVNPGIAAATNEWLAFLSFGGVNPTGMRVIPLNRNPRGVGGEGVPQRYPNRKANHSGLKVPCAPKWFDFEFFLIQTDETLSRNSLMYMSKANLPIAVH